jgi:hypothetical protein
MELNGTLQPPGSFTLREPSVREKTGYGPQPVGTLYITRDISFSCRELKTDSLVVKPAV